MERGNLYQNRDKSMRDKFEDMAREYEKYRFEYPEELYNSIFSFATKGKKALEIGIGTGKATFSFLNNDYEIVAIEPVRNMLNISKEKFKGGNISFVNSTFEELCMDEKFDLVYAASSFQWINGCDRLGKVFELLKENGTFARFKTVTIIDEDKHKNNELLKQAYLKYLPDYLPTDLHKEHISNDEYVQAGFRDFERKEFYVDHELGADAYLKMVNTYTEYLVLDSTIRNEFENYIRNCIGKGQLVVTQKCTLFLARK